MKTPCQCVHLVPEPTCIVSGIPRFLPGYRLGNQSSCSSRPVGRKTELFSLSERQNSRPEIGSAYHLKQEMVSSRSNRQSQGQGHGLKVKSHDQGPRSRSRGMKCVFYYQKKVKGQHHQFQCQSHKVSLFIDDCKI